MKKQEDSSAITNADVTNAAADEGVAGSSTASSSADFGDASQYRELNPIGTGAYATVYKAKDLKSDTIVAMKKVRITLTEDGVPMNVLREISLLRHLGKYNHPNIVKLLDICHGPRYDREMVLYLVFEHVDQDMNLYLERCPPPGLGPERIKYLMWQLLCGVDFLHSHRVIHRDLKPQNILVTDEGVLKIADFGLAKIYDFNALLTSVVVTLWYRSPEVLLGTTYATPVDIWSCGCIFAELFSRKPLFPGQNEMGQLGEIFNVLGTPSEEEWPEDSAVLRNNFTNCRSTPWKEILPEIDDDAKDLLEKMLQYDPKKRITAGEALNHPYFSEFSLAPSTSPSTSRSTRSSDVSASDSSMNMSHDTSSSSAGDTSLTDKSMT